MKSFPREMRAEDELDLRELVAILARYRRSILFVTLLFVLGAGIRAYLAPSVYQAHSLLKIAPQVQNYGGVVNEMLYPELDTAANELAVFGSRTLADRVLRHLNLGTRYYLEKGFRKIELYKRSPFLLRVHRLDPAMRGVEFVVTPLEGERFRLSVESSPLKRLRHRIGELFSGPDGGERPYEYRGIHRFGERIETPRFSLTLQKLRPMRGGRYLVTVVPNRAMAPFIQGGIHARTTTKTGNIVSLTFDDTVPERAREILDGVVRAYIESNIDYKTHSAQRQLGFIDRQIREIDRKLKESARRLQEYKASHTVVDLGEKANLTAGKMSQYQSKLYEIDMQIKALESMVRRLGEGRNPADLTLEYSQGVGTVTASLMQELQQKLTEESALKVAYTGKHPRLRAMQGQILSLRRSLREALRNDLKALKERKNGLRAIVARERQAMQQLPREEQELGELTRSFMVNQKIYSFLLEKRAETQIEKSSVVPRTRVLDPATVGGAPVRPRRMLIVLVGLILGLVIGVAQAFVRAYFDNRVKTAEDIKKLTEIPFYGMLPLIRSKRFVVHYLEAVRGIWVNLSFMKGRDASMVVAVSSMIPGEGKTLTVASLSRMIAREGGASVIVLDLDMRRARLHEQFGLDNRIGMSTLLAQRCTLEEAIQPTGIEGLDVIPSGPRSSSPTGLILSVALESLLQRLSQRYDYVFLDTPPYGLVSDTIKIMHLADLTLFVLRANLSKREYLRELNALERREEMNLGIVLNGVDIAKEYGYSEKLEYLDRYLLQRHGKERFWRL